MKLSKKQKEFWTTKPHRWNVKTGATRSGKTWLDYYIIPKRIRAIEGKPGHVVILGNTKSTIERNVLSPMRDMYGDKLVGSIRNDNTVMLFGRKCYALGAEKENQEDKIRGMSIAYCYGDEVVTWAESVFTMLKSRLDKPYSVFDGTCNPDNENHWFKKFLDSGADIYCQQYCLDDNPFLPKKFVEDLKKEYLGTVYYDRYVRGLWKNAEGLLFPQFAGNPKEWEWEGKLPAFNRVCIGIDIGGTKSHTSLVATGITVRWDTIVTFAERKVQHAKGTIDAQRLIDETIAMLDSLKLMGIMVSYIFVDNAEQVILNSIYKVVQRKHPYTQVAECKKIEGKSRILIYNRMLNLHKMWFQGVPMVVESLATALYDSESKEDKILDDFTTDIDTFDAHFYSWSKFMTEISVRL